VLGKLQPSKASCLFRRVMMPSVSFIQTFSCEYFCSLMFLVGSALTLALWVRYAGGPTEMICERTASKRPFNL
jgi:hypothetical protein